jgi:hypothetical protein
MMKVRKEEISYIMEREREDGKDEVVLQLRNGEKFVTGKGDDIYILKEIFNV